MTDNVDKIFEIVSSLEERFAALDQGLTEAQYSLGQHDWAIVLTTGEYDAMFMAGHILDDTEVQALRAFDHVLDEGIKLFGKKPDAPMFTGMSGSGVPPGTPEEYAKRWEEGFRYGLWHSAEHPSGQTLWIHYTRLFPITQEEFNKAEEVKFQVQIVGVSDWFRNLTNAVMGAIEQLPGAPSRSRCPFCGSVRTTLRTRYSGHMDSYVAVQQDGVYRLGDPLRDQVETTHSRCIHCEDCEKDGPDLPDDDAAFKVVSEPGRTALETVFNYGPDLPKPYWD